MTSEVSDETMVAIETAFFYRVLFPCWIEYGQDATDLIEEARDEAGRWDRVNVATDKTAMEKLLRLDKLTIHDPVIARWYAKLGQERGPDFKAVCRWLAASPSSALNTKKVKRFFAAYLSLASEILEDRLSIFPPVMREELGGRKVTAPELAELFEAHALDTKGTRRDDDMWEKDEDSFRKGIQRYRKFLERLMPTGQ